MASVEEQGLELEKKLADARAAYHKVAHTETDQALRERSDAIVGLMEQIGKLYATDAMLCPKCGGQPHGIRHTISFGGIALDLFEIGCIPCPNGYRTDAITRELAVKQWNQGANDFRENKNMAPDGLPLAWKLAQYPRNAEGRRV